MSTTDAAKAPEILQLDIQGQVCPSCLLQALKAVNQNRQALRSKVMDILILTDDRQATATIPEAVARMGYHSKVDRTDAGYQIRIHGC